MNAAFILDADTFRDAYGDECVKTVATLGRVLGPPMTAEQLAASPPPWLEDVEALFTSWGGPRLDAVLLARLPKLRAVFHAAGSLRAIATEACWQRGIVFSTAAALNAIPTAEYAFGAILLSLKRAWQQASAANARRSYPIVPQTPLMHFPGGYGSTVGLVSLGQVGRRVAEWLRGTDVNAIACDPFAAPEVFGRHRLKRASLEEIFSEADVVSLHTPLLPETVGMIDLRLLNRLKPGATLINTSRGAIVREMDLVAVLRARPDVQAIVDVTDPEPPDANSPLYDLPNLFLTPHIAGSLGPECRRMGLAMVDEFARLVRGEPLRHAVTRADLARQA
jgi:phosphoglycerate dehydrogenase-like enzyme